MVSRTSPSVGESRPGAPGEAPRGRVEAVLVLERLLSILFPGPPSLDCITIDDVLRRYRLTGLGAPALTAIEQSQRIVRARGDYGQTGLGEFHVGLIYFNWEDFRAAAAQFALARQPWTLAGDHSANCLTHFAQGLALYHAYHNEAAMLQFGRAERLLARTPHGTASIRHAALAEQMRPLLLAAQEALRENMWPEDRQPEIAARSYLSVPPLRATPRDERDNVIYGHPPPPPAGRLEARRVFERASRPSGHSGQAARPISNMPGGPDEAPRGPVPGHIVVDDRFGWYIVVDRHGNFMPSVGAGMWLLVDAEVDERRTAGSDLVIVGSQQAGLGGIVVQPMHQASLVPFCYLGLRTVDGDGTATLFVDDSRQPISGLDVLVLALVEGMWSIPVG